MTDDNLKRKEVTEEFRVSYNYAITPRNNDNGDPVYSVTMIFENEEAIANLVQLAEEVAYGTFGKSLPPRFKWPWRLGTSEEFNLEKNPEYEDKIIISARSHNMKPGLVYSDLTPIVDPSEFYSGCYARATLRCFAYGNGTEAAKKTGGNKGVSFSLQNLMKTRDGERLGGSFSKAEDDFASVASAPAKNAAKKSLFGGKKSEPANDADDL